MGKGVASRESSELTESLLSNGELESVLQDRVDVDEKGSAVIESAEHIDDSSLSASHAARQNSPLEQLDDSFYYYFRWATLDMLLQNVLQRMVLSFFKPTSEEAQPVLSDVPLEAAEEKGEAVAVVPRRACCRRPHGRYTPLDRVNELKSVYAIQSGLSFFQKLVFRSLNAFIATLLVYRSTHYLSGAQGLEFMEFEQLFSDPEQDGIDTLVRLLADLNSEALLYVLLSFPFVLGMLRGALASVTAKGLTEDAQRDFLSHRTAKVSEQSFLRDAIIPLFPRGFSGQMGDVGTSLCWDGRIAPEARQKLLRVLQDVAKQGHYVTQIVAMRELSYLAHGGGARDLQTVSAELSEAVLAQRHGALQTLQQIYGQGISSGRYYYPRNLVQHVYAAYLLWWLGLSPSRWLSSGFFLFKTAKLTLQVLLIGKIIQSIETVLRCRHRSFKFDTGYVYGSDLFSTECFLKRLELFRLLNKKESVSEFVKTFSQYNLRELTEIVLPGQPLTMDEITLILDGLVTQGVSKQIKKFSITVSWDSYNPETFSYPLANFPNLEELELSVNLLHPQVLRGLVNLKWLYLDIMQEIVWAADMLCDLKQVERLTLFTSTKELPENLFESLTRLKQLDLSTSSKELPENLFHSLDQLTGLELKGLFLTNLPANLLQKNILLDEFSLSVDSPRLFILPPSLFASTIELRVIDITVPSEFQWDFHIFSFTPLLKRLAMSGGQFMTTSAMLPPLSRLKTLDVYNTIWHDKIPENLFNELFCLQNLSLTRSQLQALPVKLFQPLRQLKKLNLRDNHLEFVDFIRELPPMLKSLDISDNRIKVFPANASSYFPDSLEEISFSKNPFIPKTITRTFLKKHLPLTTRVLSLHGSNIDSDALYDLSELESIYLRGSFFQLPSELFRKNPILTHISIITRNLLYLPDAFFTHQQNLLSLSLESNVLQPLPPRLFIPLRNLRSLSMDLNHTAPLQATHFTYLKQLEELHITKVKNFPIEILPQLTQLKELGIADSPVNTLPAGLHLLASLRSMVFSNCGLTDQAITNLANDFPSNLRSLRLGYNHITSQGIEVLQAILPCSQLQRIGLDGNPGYTEQGRIDLNIQNRLLRDVCEDERCQALSLERSCEERSAQKVLPQSNAFSLTEHHASLGFFGARYNYDRAPRPLPNAAYSTSAYVGSMWLLWPTVTMGLLLVFTCLLYLRNRTAGQAQKQQIIIRERIDIDPQEQVTKLVDHEPQNRLSGRSAPAGAFPPQNRTCELPRIRLKQ